MSSILVNTLIFSAGILIVSGLATFFIIDYWLLLTGRETFSMLCHQLVREYQSFPALWVIVGVLIGIVVGLLTGFVLGHLFWQ